jgi:hypothetical protein
VTLDVLKALTELVSSAPAEFRQHYLEAQEAALQRMDEAATDVFCGEPDDTPWDDLDEYFAFRLKYDLL